MKEKYSYKGIKYWYRTTIWYCPVCCSENKFKQRVYDIKDKGTFYTEVYDWCEG